MISLIFNNFMSDDHRFSFNFTLTSHDLLNIKLDRHSWMCTFHLSIFIHFITIKVYENQIRPFFQRVFVMLLVMLTLLNFYTIYFIRVVFKLNLILIQSTLTIQEYRSDELSPQSAANVYFVVHISFVSIRKEKTLRVDVANDLNRGKLFFLICRSKFNFHEIFLVRRLKRFWKLIFRDCIPCVKSICM